MQALWMLVAAFMFASMGVCVKSPRLLSTAELVFYRGLVGMVLLARLRSTSVSSAHPVPGNARLARHGGRDARWVRGTTPLPTYPCLRP